MLGEGRLPTRRKRRTADSPRDEMSAREEASEEAIKALAKKCPNEACKSCFQKNGGCNHMMCEFVVSCEESTSWVCVLMPCRLEVST